MLFQSLLLTVLQQGVAAQADDATTLLQLKADIGLTGATAWSGSQPCAAGVMAAGTAAAGSDGQGQAFPAFVLTGAAHVQNVGAVWPYVTCCEVANVGPRVCELNLSGLGLGGTVPMLGESRPCLHLQQAGPNSTAAC